MSRYSELYAEIDELKVLEFASIDMYESWINGSEEDQALSDPGLQYELDTQIDTKLFQIESIIRKLRGL